MKYWYFISKFADKSYKEYGNFIYNKKAVRNEIDRDLKQLKPILNNIHRNTIVSMLYPMMTQK